MPEFQFFGAESILINKSVCYLEGRGGGRYVFDPVRLGEIISTYKQEQNYFALEQMIKEIFWICNQGRRPWSLDAEEAFLSLASIGYNLLSYLRPLHKVSFETYSFIDPLVMVLRLEHESEHIQSSSDNQKWIGVLNIFYQLTKLYINIFDSWTKDYSHMVKIPTINDIKFLLEIGDDQEFGILLNALSLTRKLEMKGILTSF